MILYAINLRKNSHKGHGGRKDHKGKSGVDVQELSVGLHDKITDKTLLFPLRVLLFLSVLCVPSYGNIIRKYRLSVYAMQKNY
jgi:hypothetical protein